MSTFAGVAGKQGSEDGDCSSATFHSPFDVQCDQKTGFLYVADYGNNKIRRISNGRQHTHKSKQY